MTTLVTRGPGAQQPGVSAGHTRCPWATLNRVACAEPPVRKSALTVPMHAHMCVQKRLAAFMCAQQDGAIRTRDFAQYLRVRADARQRGTLIVWAYPRGAAIDAKGGKDSFYAVDCAARTASELGADAVVRSANRTL